MMITKILKFLYINLFSRVYKSQGCKSAYISYISDPFYKKSDTLYLNKHQNRRETLLLGEIFEDLGFGLRVERFDKRLFLKKKDYDLIFGIEPNFVRISESNSQAIKIYYATGSYFEHQNKMIKNRTDEFNAKHSTNLVYNRLVEPHPSCEIADYIFQIGSNRTIETYPEELRKKIILIRQTCHTFKNYQIEDKYKRYDRKHFIWMGSKGSILKGLDLVLDYFIKNSEYNLYIIGDIDPDFYSFYQPMIDVSTNINYVGFLDMDDPTLIDIANQSTAIIFPSASEGGIPGSVINLMKLGLIPIVSKWCSFDGIENLGYEITELDDQGIEKSIDWVNRLSSDDLERLFLENYKYANENFNISTFSLDIKNNLEKIL